MVLFFAVHSLATQWNKVEARLIHIQFGWEWIAAATALVLVTYALLIEGWRRILEAWDSHLPFIDAARIWFLSNLGKYVPGNVWSLTAMGVMARKRGLSAIAAAGSSVIMQVVSLLTGTAIVMVTGAKLLGQPVLVGAALLMLAALLFILPDQKAYDCGGHARAGRRVDILHPRNLPKQLLHRFGDALLHFARRCAWHLDEDIHHRYDNLRLFLAGKL